MELAAVGPRMEKRQQRSVLRTTVSNCEPVGPKFKVELTAGVAVLEKDAELEVSSVAFRSSLPLTTR